ncbi:Amuc_1100 family pilus-like protein [bacterium]|jgi:hypothetical protein|nr:Amuc_1100 family pilus-like protein [bacterium]
MNWVKSNIGLVIGGVVALALMGVAGYFLFTQMEAEKRAQANLEQGLSNLKSLLQRDPHPGDPDNGVDNISAVKVEQSKVDKNLLGPLRSLFKPFTVPSDLDTFKFKSLLEERIAMLQRAARKAGTGLPKDGDAKYSFSFSDVRPKVSFAPETLAPMAFQLAQIESISHVLFDSKVHSINGIKRPEVAVAEEEVEEDEDDFDDEESAFSSFSLGTSSDNHIEDEVLTNSLTGAIIYPFQLSFQCFASELSGVMGRFNDNDHFFRVKWMVVEQSAKSNKSADPNAGLYAPSPPMGGMDPGLASRYGMGAGGGGGRYGGAGGGAMGGRYGGGMGGRYGGMGQSGAGMSYGMPEDSSMDDLEEKPLTVNMLLEVISIPPPVEESDDDLASEGY